MCENEQKKQSEVTSEIKGVRERFRDKHGSTVFTCSPFFFLYEEMWRYALVVGWSDEVS